MQEGEPAEAPLLIGPQLTTESFGSRQGVGGLLLVVLLQHRLQPWAGIEAVHRHPHQQFPFRSRQPQCVVEAQFRFRATEAFGVLEVVGPQFDPGPLVAHQGAALAAQALQFPQGERHPADHQIPLPVQTFAQGETPGSLWEFSLDRQAQPAGQAAGEAGRQLHPHAGIPQLAGSRAHQHEGFGRGQLHRVRCGALQAPFDRREHRQGSSQALQQHFARLIHLDFPKLQHLGTGGPGCGGRELQAGVSFRLQSEAQLPEILPIRWGVQFKAGAGRSKIAGDALPPVMAGCGQAFGLFIADLDHPGLRPQGLLPEGQQGIKPIGGGLKVLAQLRVHQVFQQRRHPQASAAGPAAGHRVGGPHRLWPQSGGAVAAAPQGFPPGQGAGGHQRQAGRQILEPAPVFFPVEQRHPTGPMGIALPFAELHLGNPAAPGHQAQGPALQMAPPAQFVSQVWIGTGEGQSGQPLRGSRWFHREPLHLPGPPFGLLGDRFAGLHR